MCVFCARGRTAKTDEPIVSRHGGQTLVGPKINPWQRRTCMLVRWIVQQPALTQRPAAFFFDNCANFLEYLTGWTLATTNERSARGGGKPFCHQITLTDCYGDYQYKNAGKANDWHDNGGRRCRAWHCRKGHWWTKLQVMTMQDTTMWDKTMADVTMTVADKPRISYWNWTLTARTTMIDRFQVRVELGRNSQKQHTRALGNVMCLGVGFISLTMHFFNQT